ncbi:hypothetical protein ANN_07335 [Periplaneta americana]|uniref:REM-1 domain-containing protein n=1 Tax=Periplaneta americana TaxID=6978 RepID=A0ABQ8SZR7_PERAM|nr:hypothetical protein ANN_07335 [Periplaneta americana]
MNTLRGRTSTPAEYDLEQKIDLEIKMREGTTKLLAACRHQTQTLEAAKNLLTSNERMSAYMAELQRRKREAPTRSLGYSSQPCTARVSLSDLRMPLIWRDTDHFKNKGDYRRFAVFCLARIGTEIYDTSLLCPVDRSLTDLTFSDVLIFNQIPADFEFRLEVYSHILQDDLSMASTPRKIKKTIHSSISRTVGKKLAASLRDELNTGKIGPHFELMATARLSLDDIHDSIRTHDLQLENLENRSHQLPLFGHFCCRLAAQPDCVAQESCSGDLTLLDCDAGRQWLSMWGQLQAFRLDLWNKREHWEQGQDPVRSIVVDRETVIQPSKTVNKEITISNLCEGKEDISVIRTKTTEDHQKWLRSLVQHAKDHLRAKYKHQVLCFAGDMISMADEDGDFLNKMKLVLLGLMHHEFIPEGRTVTKELYVETLCRLWDAVRRKRPEKWVENNWFLMHDNAPAHRAIIVKNFLARHNITALDHPPYSPDLSPPDYFLFPRLKSHLKGRRFNAEEVIANATRALRRVSQNGFQACFQELYTRWQKWKHAAEKIMEIQSPGSARHSFTRQLRGGSLYDETPLIESVSTDYHRPTVQEIFGMTPSTSLSSCASSSSSPTFRERSYSSGGSNRGRMGGGGTVRTHWPFSRNSQD